MHYQAPPSALPRSSAWVIGWRDLRNRVSCTSNNATTRSRKLARAPRFAPREQQRSFAHGEKNFMATYAASSSLSPSEEEKPTAVERNADAVAPAMVRRRVVVGVMGGGADSSSTGVVGDLAEDLGMAVQA